MHVLPSKISESDRTHTAEELRLFLSYFSSFCEIKQILDKRGRKKGITKQQEMGMNTSQHDYSTIMEPCCPLTITLFTATLFPGNTGDVIVSVLLDINSSISNHKGTIMKMTCYSEGAGSDLED